MAFRGGCYADYLPGWFETLGTERVRVIDFARLARDQSAVLRATAEWLHLDPAAFPPDALEPENRTTGYKHAGFQRIALAGNDRLERILRRHPDMKRRLRGYYYRLNGRATREDVPAAVRDELMARYDEPNARLARELDAAGIVRPEWLTAQTGSG
jgi:hypothetical protein